MALTQFSQAAISPRTTVFATREMLKAQEPVVILSKFAKQYKVPKNKNTAVKMRRRRVFSTQSVPLLEGVTPNLTTFEYEDESVNLLQYGRVVGITDVIEDTHEDPVLKDIMTELGLDIGRTQEALNWAVVQSGTNVFYANASARADVNTAVSLAKQRAVTRALKEQKAQKITSMLDGSPNFQTRAIEGSYVAVAHTHHENDIRALPGFIPCASYGSRKMICDEEIGAVEDVRYVLSPDLSPTLAGGSSTLNGMVSAGAANVDIYPIIYMGMESWGTVAIRGLDAVEPTIIPVNQKTKDDPLGQRGYAGYKFWHGALILNDLWLARLECGVTDL